MTDCGFPLIQYEPGATPLHWGQCHGESMRQGIAELVAIRRGLLRERHPRITDDWIEQRAAEQWAATARYDEALATELGGIAQGAGISIADLVVLNNYTDFRDLPVPDEGCSVVCVHAGGNRIAGQTWDMHGSAKQYVCVLQIPGRTPAANQLIFSVVGCVGMMGYSGRRFMVGVNNIHTDGARSSLLWPVLIRRLLAAGTHAAMTDELQSAPVTSGHAYLVVSDVGAEAWEVMPGLAERVAALDTAAEGYVVHTNHCLGTRSRSREVAAAVSSTTHRRLELLLKKVPHVRQMEQLYDLLNDHENYPLSICSHYQTHSQDPSVTCGGAAADLGSGRVVMWRGDPLTDDHFKIRRFQM